MQFAYSILLGEYVSAESCDYSDSKAFQLVCAGSCKEPVFKVVRKLANRDVHYFSHYREDSADPIYRECELRVKGLSKEYIEQVASTARGQRLELFMQVMRNEIWSTHFPNREDVRKAETIIFRRIVHNPVFNDFFAGYKKHLYRNRFSYGQIQTFIDGYLEDWREVGGGPFPTELHLTTQRRIVWDLYESLLSSAAKDNLNFLNRFSYMWLLDRTSRGLADIPAAPDDIERSNKLRFVLMEIYEGRWEMRQFYEPEFESILTKFAAELFHESLGLLLRVDWVAVLMRHLERKAVSA